MKKLSVYTLSLLLLLGLGACTEDSELPAPPQAWEQETSKPGTSFAATAASPVNLAQIADGGSVAICTFTAPAVSEGTISYEVSLDGAVVLPIKEDGVITKETLQEAVVNLYGKRPEQRTLAVVVSAFVDNNGQVSRLDASKVDLLVTPEAPYIEEGYYLVGDMCGWSIEAALPFQHSGNDVYEDPLFSIIVETKGNSYWKIIPKSNIDKEDLWANGVLGVAENGSTDATGILITQDPQAGRIEDPGFVRITLDMMEYTYSIEPFDGSPYLYVAGSHQQPEGWKPEYGEYVYSEDMKNYQGFFYLTGEFKFTSQKNWDGPNYGNGGDNTLSTDAGAKNLTVETAGFYLLKASLESMTWSTDRIESFGLIGDATQGGWDNSTPMEFDQASSTYTVTTTLTDGAFKFRANNGWDINLGGDVNQLSFGGDNISVAAGTYVISLNLSDAARYTATVVKQ